MAKITLFVKPDLYSINVDESYDSLIQMVEAPTRYLRCSVNGVKVTYQKSFIFKIEEGNTEL